MKNLPKIIPIFPLSNFIIFPKTEVPLNIFEDRYIDMINDSMKSNKYIGMIQPVNSKDIDEIHPKLHSIGCLGKITSFKETEDKRYLIELKGLIRFETLKEINANKKYRKYEVDYQRFPMVKILRFLPQKCSLFDTDGLSVLVLNPNKLPHPP